MGFCSLEKALYLWPLPTGSEFSFSEEVPVFVAVSLVLRVKQSLQDLKITPYSIMNTKNKIFWLH